MLHLGVVVMGVYFCLTSLWWLAQTTTRFYQARQRHIDFHSSVTFPCCYTCRSQPVDGLLKLCLGLVLALAEFSFDKDYTDDHDFLSRMELGTIFMFLMFSGVMDVLKRWGSRTFYQYVDYAGLVMFFGAVVVVLESKAYVSPLPLSSLHSLSGYVAGVSVVVTVVEGVKNEEVLLPVSRSYLLLLQGTWWLHVAVLTAGKSFVLLPSSEDVNETVMLLSVLFCVHAALNFAVVVGVWLLVGKLSQRWQCACVGVEGGTHNEDVFLENRVRFNYHVLTRFDSETE